MSKAKEIKVGILVILSSVILYSGLNFLKGKDFFSSENTYYIEYEKIDGHTPGNPVILNGFPVGRVESIQMIHEKNNVLRVAVLVDENLKLYEGAKATLTSALLDGMSIVLVNGSSQTLVEDKATLQGVYETSIASLVTEKAMPILSNIDTTFMKLNSLFDEEVKGNFVEMMRKYNAMSSNLLSASARIDKLIADKESNINAAISKIGNMSDSLMLLSHEANMLMKKLNTFGDSLNAMDIQATILQIQALALNLNSIAEKVNHGKGTLGKLINEDTTYAYLNSTIYDLNLLIANFNANPKHFLAPLGKSAKRIEKDRKEAQQQALINKRIQEQLNKSRN